MSNAKTVFTGSTNDGQEITVATTKRAVAEHSNNTITFSLWALVANVDGGQAEILSLHNNYCGASDKRWTLKKQDNTRIQNLEIVSLTAQAGA